MRPQSVAWDLRRSTAGCLVATGVQAYGRRMAILPRVIAVPGVRPHAAAAAESAPLRRCTFRYMKVQTNAPGAASYDVSCTFPDRERKVPLGDLESAQPICAACTYQGIFRADSD